MHRAAHLQPGGQRACHCLRRVRPRRSVHLLSQYLSSVHLNAVNPLTFVVLIIGPSISSTDLIRVRGGRRRRADLIYTASSLLVTLKNSCSKLHCQKFFKLKSFSYKIAVCAPRHLVHRAAHLQPGGQRACHCLRRVRPRSSVHSFS